MLHKNILEMKSNGTTHHYFSKGNDYRSLTFSRLYNKSLSLAYILSQKGIAKESPIGLILNAPDEFIISFIACTMLGNPCIPIATPNIGYNLENYSSLISQILNVSKAKTLLVGEEILSSLVDIDSNNIELLPFQTIDNFNSNYFSPAENSPDDICFYQFTSGSTGNPKGVMISYENLLNNIEGMVKRLEISSHDQIVSWLPMYHDMGFIGKVVLPIVSKTSVVYIPTSKFIRNPKVWFNAITRYNATISFVPNFSLSLICKRYMNDDLTQVDLSSIRTIGCGAEPISAKLVERFLSQFKKCGLKKTAFLPSYGMAETTLAITMSHPNLDYKQVYIDKDKYANKNISVIDKHNNRHGISLVSCGSPIDNYMVKIVNENFEDVGSDVVGNIFFWGLSATKGYVNNKEATEALFQDGWLDTGDIGFIHDGEVYISGRSKDVIIINGRNIYPQDIEWHIDSLEETRIGSSIALEVDSGETKSYVVICEIRKVDDIIENSIYKICREHIGLLPEEIIFVKRGTIPKTTSGKVKRAALKELYINNSLEIKRLTL